jgi:ABC-type branched-subunit amino acid transport system ATPase component
LRTCAAACPVEPGLQVHLLAFAGSNLDDANERAEELMEMIKLDKKRRHVLAMNLTYAEQRALEIGITIDRRRQT